MLHGRYAWGCLYRRLYKGLPGCRLRLGEANFVWHVCRQCLPLGRPRRGRFLCAAAGWGGGLLFSVEDCALHRGILRRSRRHSCWSRNVGRTVGRAHCCCLAADCGRLLLRHAATSNSGWIACSCLRGLRPSAAALGVASANGCAGCFCCAGYRALRFGCCGLACVDCRHRNGFRPIGGPAFLRCGSRPLGGRLLYGRDVFLRHALGGLLRIGLHVALFCLTGNLCPAGRMDCCGRLCPCAGMGCVDGYG